MPLCKLVYRSMCAAFVVFLTIFAGCKKEPQPTLDPGQRAWLMRSVELRNKMQETLDLPHDSYGVDPQTSGTIDADHYTIEKVTYDSEPGSRITANLYLPKTPAPHPAVIVACGHGGSKSSPYAQYAGQLYAAVGFACLVPDTIGEEERNAERKLGTRAHDMTDLGNANPIFVQAKLGRMILGKIVWDLMCGVDYLSSRDDIDAERIGMMGYSLGGASAGCAAIVDRRIRAAVITGWAFRQHYATASKWCTRMPYAAFAEYMSFAEMTALPAPHCHMLFINGTADTILDPDRGGAAVVEDLRNNIDAAGWRLATVGAPEAVQAIFVDGGGHRPYFLTRPAVQWFAEYLARPGQAFGIPDAEITLGHWADEQGITFEKLYNTEVNERGCRVVDIGAVCRKPEELACLPLDAPPPAEYTFQGWVEEQKAAKQQRDKGPPSEQDLGMPLPKTLEELKKLEETMRPTTLPTPP